MTSTDRFRLAGEAGCDPRSVARIYEGRTTPRTLVLERVTAAARRLGFPLPPGMTGGPPAPALAPAARCSDPGAGALDETVCRLIAEAVDPLARRVAELEKRLANEPPPGWTRADWDHACEVTGRMSFKQPGGNG